MVWIFSGIILGALFLLPTRWQTKPNRINTIAVGLVMAALIYVGFAIWGRAGAIWLMIEIVGVVIYAAFAWLGVSRSVLWLGVGWALHVVWDVSLHQSGAGHLFTPFWYPPICIGFDLMIVLGLALDSGWLDKSKNWG